MSFFENTRKPTGFGGELMVNLMNWGHTPLACVFIWDNRYAANLLLNFTAKWNIPSVMGTDQYAKYQTCGITARCCMM